jgi:hypothetical protein
MQFEQFGYQLEDGKRNDLLSKEAEPNQFIKSFNRNCRLKRIRRKYVSLRKSQTKRKALREKKIIFQTYLNKMKLILKKEFYITSANNGNC